MKTYAIALTVFMSSCVSPREIVYVDAHDNESFVLAGERCAKHPGAHCIIEMSSEGEYLAPLVLNGSLGSVEIRGNGMHVESRPQ